MHKLMYHGMLQGARKMPRVMINSCGPSGLLQRGYRVQVHQAGQIGERHCAGAGFCCAGQQPRRVQLSGKRGLLLRVRRQQRPVRLNPQ